VEHGQRGELVLKRNELVALCGRAFAFDAGAGESAFQFTPLAAKRSHEHRFNERSDVGFAGVVRAELRALLRLNSALKQRAHDARLNELPVGFGGFRELGDFSLGQFKDGRFLEQVAVEVASCLGAEVPPFGHDAEKFFQQFGKQARVFQTGLGHLGKQFRRQQAGVVCKQAKYDAVEKAGYAEIFFLSNAKFFARPGVLQFYALAALQRAANFGDLFGELFGDLRGRALRFEEVGIVKQGAENPQVFGPVNLVVVEFVDFLDRAVEIRADDVAVEMAK